MRADRFFAFFARLLRDESFLAEPFPSDSAKAPNRHPPIRLDDPRIQAAGTTQGITAANAIQLSGKVLLMSAVSHASARLEVCFDEPTSDRAWLPLAPTHRVRRPDGGTFRQIFLRRLDAAVPSTANVFYLIADDANPGDSVVEEGRFPQVSPGGSTQSLMVATRGSDGTTEQPVIVDDNGALVGALWTGAAYVRSAGSAAGRALVNLIVGQDGVAGGAGASSASTLRTVGAIPSSGPSITQSVPNTSTSTQILAANASRAAAVVTNRGTNDIHVAIGQAASSTTRTLVPGESFTFVGSGAIAGWNNGAAAANAEATDFTL